MKTSKTETSERNESKQQIAKQRHTFTSVSDFVKYYFPNYYEREYRYKEEKEAYFQKLHPTSESEGSKSSRSPKAI
jgi:hypothetical protein